MEYDHPISGKSFSQKQVYTSIEQLFRRNHTQMKSNSNIRITAKRLMTLSGFLGLWSFFLIGCQTAKNGSGNISTIQENHVETIVLTEGDSIKISFPGTPNLDTVQPIRRDGKVVLPIVGEVVAAGKTPSQLEKELEDLYAPQLVSSKQVTGAIQSSSFPVYVSGSVLRPGKVLSDRPITALEAIMESGGFDNSRANMKNVRVIRNQDGKVLHFSMDLRGILNGTKTQSFYLKPYDIIYVPEKFSWF